MVSVRRSLCLTQKRSLLVRKVSGLHIHALPASSLEHLTMGRAIRPPTQNTTHHCAIRALTLLWSCCHRITASQKHPASSQKVSEGTDVPRKRQTTCPPSDHNPDQSSDQRVCPGSRDKPRKRLDTGGTKPRPDRKVYAED